MVVLAFRQKQLTGDDMMPPLQKGSRKEGKVAGWVVLTVGQTMSCRGTEGKKKSFREGVRKPMSCCGLQRRKKVGERC